MGKTSAAPFSRSGYRGRQDPARRSVRACGARIEAEATGRIGEETGVLVTVAYPSAFRVRPVELSYRLEEPRRGFDAVTTLPRWSVAQWGDLVQNTSPVACVLGVLFAVLLLASKLEHVARGWCALLLERLRTWCRTVWIGSPSELLNVETEIRGSPSLAELTAPSAFDFELLKKQGEDSTVSSPLDHSFAVDTVSRETANWEDASLEELSSMESTVEPDAPVSESTDPLEGTRDDDSTPSEEPTVHSDPSTSAAPESLLSGTAVVCGERGVETEDGGCPIEKLSLDAMHAAVFGSCVKKNLVFEAVAAAVRKQYIETELEPMDASTPSEIESVALRTTEETTSDDTLPNAARIELREDPSPAETAQEEANCGVFAVQLEGESLSTEAELGENEGSREDEMSPGGQGSADVFRDVSEEASRDDVHVQSPLIAAEVPTEHPEEETEVSFPNETAPATEVSLESKSSLSGDLTEETSSPSREATEEHNEASCEEPCLEMESPENQLLVHEESESIQYPSTEDTASVNETPEQRPPRGNTLAAPLLPSSALATAEVSLEVATTPPHGGQIQKHPGQAKRALLAYLNSAGSTPADEEAIAERIQDLISLSPQPRHTESQALCLLWGDWELIYTTDKFVQRIQRALSATPVLEEMALTLHIDGEHRHVYSQVSIGAEIFSGEQACLKIATSMEQPLHIERTSEGSLEVVLPQILTGIDLDKIQFPHRLKLLTVDLNVQRWMTTLAAIAQEPSLRVARLIPSLERFIPETLLDLLRSRLHQRLTVGFLDHEMCLCAMSEVVYVFQKCPNDEDS